MSKRDTAALRDYLEHIAEAISRIERYLETVDAGSFFKNEEKQDAVIRNLEIIGEAAGNILRHFPRFARANPEMPLRAAYGMRNALAHGYFKVDLAAVWKTAERDLPELKRLVLRSLKTLV